MRDGVTLHTEIDMPPNVTAGTRVAALLDRSPYGSFATELLADIGLTDFHAAVRQNVRGTSNSGGYFSLWHTCV